MKFNFRKIASVLTSAVMLSSTIALAAAANFPAPFVNSAGVGDYAVVYGSGTTATDGVAAADINKFLSDRVTVPSNPPVVTNSTPTDGDFVQLQKTNDKFNLGDKTNSFQTTLDVEDLPKVLADGIYTNAAGSDFDYEQTIKLGAITLGFQEPTNRFNGKVPWVGFSEPSGGLVMNYTLEFTDNAEGGASFANLQNTVVNMLGRDYYISTAQNTSTGLKLTLLDTANSLRITEGDTQTVTVGNSTVKIKVVSISGTGDTAAVSLAVNDVELSSDLSTGETSKIRGTDMYVGVKKISTSSRETTAQSAVITVGTGQLVLDNGKEVQLNGKDLSSLDQYSDWTLNSYITISNTDLASLVLEWKTNDKVYMKSGGAWTMPGFEAVKLSMGDFVTPTAEETTLQDSSDSAQISTEIKDGSVEFSMFRSNETNILGLGSDTDEQLYTTSSTSTGSAVGVAVPLEVDNNTYFAASWTDGSDNAESYMYRIRSVGSAPDNETILENMAGGSDLDFKKVGDSKDIGDMTFTLLTASKAAQTATINVTASSGTAYFDRVFTKAGLTFKLPVSTTAGGDGVLNVSITPSSWTQNFTEADKDANIQKGKSFRVTWAPSSDGTQPNTVNTNDVSLYDQEDNSDTKVGYVVSDLASYLVFNNPSSGAKDLLVQYHPTESYGQVFVTESNVQLSEGGSDGGSAGTVIVTDAQVSSVSSKNLVVVGGACVNTVAAKLLNSDTPVCEAAWTSATSAGAGAFLIKTYANPYSTTKVATLVAGYDAADTVSAVNALKVRTDIDTTVGKTYVQRPGSTLQLV